MSTRYYRRFRRTYFYDMELEVVSKPPYTYPQEWEKDQHRISTSRALKSKYFDFWEEDEVLAARFLDQVFLCSLCGDFYQEREFDPWTLVDGSDQPILYELPFEFKLHRECCHAQFNGLCVRLNNSMRLAFCNALNQFQATQIRLHRAMRLGAIQASPINSLFEWYRIEHKFQTESVPACTLLILLEKHLNQKLKEINEKRKHPTPNRSRSVEHCRNCSA